MDTITCDTCDRPAVCIGAYEGQTQETLACNTCCGHGNEDGHCRPWLPHAFVLCVGDQNLAACVDGEWSGWLFYRHPDGQWVSQRKLTEEEFSQASCVWKAEEGK